jgi:hypothetical protein
MAIATPVAARKQSKVAIEIRLGKDMDLPSRKGSIIAPPLMNVSCTALVP